MARHAGGLEPTSAEFRTWLAQVADALVTHLDALPEAPSAGDMARASAEADAVSVPIPEEPTEGMAELLARLDRAVATSLTTPGPGYLAYVPGGGLPSAGIARLYAAITNRFTGLEAPAPVLGRLEADVLRWLCGELGLGPDARGLLTSGGSLANLCAVIAARHHHFGDSGDFRDARVICSSDAHHSVAKAVRLAGLPRDNVVSVPVDGARRLLPERVADVLGRPGRPFLLVASAGTTNTGAIDPLPGLAALCREAGLWLHVDGAYGGAWALCAEGRRRLEGIGEADSVTLDPHKGLFVPYGCGCLLVRDGAHLRAAFGSEGSYLRDLGPSTLDPAALGPELSRPYRGLDLWLPLMLHGARAFREALTEKLDLAEKAWRGLAALPLEVLERPQLTTVAFRPPRREQEPIGAWNARTDALLSAVNSHRRVWMSSTTLDGVRTLRACVVSFRTHAEHIDWLLEDVAAALAATSR